MEHELPLDLIRHFPVLAPCLPERASKVPLPEFSRARCDSGDATTTAPPELRADAVVVLERGPAPGVGSPVPVLVIVVECQRRPDERKRFGGPAYVANLRARLKCPTVLLTLSPSRAVAEWCAAPIDLGWGSLVHRPVALSLADLPPDRRSGTGPRRTGTGDPGRDRPPHRRSGRPGRAAARDRRARPRQGSFVR